MNTNDFLTLFKGYTNAQVNEVNEFLSHNMDNDSPENLKKIEEKSCEMGYLIAELKAQILKFEKEMIATDICDLY
jgi:hypothetical protein